MVPKANSVNKVAQNGASRQESDSASDKVMGEELGENHCWESCWTSKLFYGKSCSVELLQMLLVCLRVLSVELLKEVASYI
jgi:hypothetical protein